MSVISSNKKDSSVSSVIGTIVLLALVVTSTAVIAGTVISNINDNAQVGSIISFEASADPYRLYHAGGDPIQLSQIYILYTDKEGYSREITKFSKIIEGGKEPQYIMSDDSLAVEIWNTGEALAPYYMNNEVNVSEILIVSTLGGRTTEIYKGSDYVVGIIPFGPKDHTVGYEIIGFKTNSDPSETPGDNYELIYSSLPRIGVIIRLTGDDISYVSDLDSINIGGLTYQKWVDQSSSSKYVYTIGLDKGGNNYDVSGIVNFIEGQNQKISKDNVYIPKEPELTFHVGTYAKYKNGSFSDSNHFRYVGHGIYINLTGGTEFERVESYNVLSVNAISLYNDEVITLSSATKVPDSSQYQITYDKGISNDVKKYYYLASAKKDYRYGYKLSEIELSVKYNGESDEKIVILNEEDIYEKILYPWSPLYENEWYNLISYEENNPLNQPFDTEINLDPESNLVKIKVSNGYFPDIQYSGERKSKDGKEIRIFPVSMKVELISGDNRKITINDNESIGYNNDNSNYVEYSITPPSGTEITDDSVVIVTFTMTDKEYKGRNLDGDIELSSYRVTNSENVPIDDECDVTVTVKGYQKRLSGYLTGKNYDSYRGHGLLINVSIADDKKSTISDAGENYLLDIYLKNGNQEYLITGGNYYISPDINFDPTNAQHKTKSVNGKLYAWIIKDNLKLGKDEFYYAIGSISKDFKNNMAFEDPEIIITLCKYIDGDKDVTKIREVYNTSNGNSDVQIPARDLLLEDYTIKGYSQTIDGTFYRGLCLTMYADLSEVNPNKEIYVNYNVAGVGNIVGTKAPDKSEGSADYYYFPFVSGSSTAESATDILIKAGDFVIPIYDYATRLSAEAQSKKTTTIKLPTTKIAINGVSSGDSIRGTGTITASVTNLNGAAPGGSVIWSSSDESKLSINSATGEYTVIAESGEKGVNITAVLSSNPLISASVTVKCVLGLPDGHIEDSNGNEYTLSNYKSEWGTIIDTLTGSEDSSILKAGNSYKDNNGDYWIVLKYPFDLTIKKSGSNIIVKKGTDSKEISIADAEDITIFNQEIKSLCNGGDPLIKVNLDNTNIVTKTKGAQRGNVMIENNDIYVFVGFGPYAYETRDEFWIKIT